MGNKNKKIASKYSNSKLEHKEDFSNDSKSGKLSKDEKYGTDKNGKRYRTWSKKNDISWYVTDPQILADVARVYYSIPVGFPMTRRGSAPTNIVPSGYDDAIPGIAAMRIIPTIGNAQFANDAVNVAANGLYTFVRHLNSGSRNYFNNDLIIYCMAVNSIYYVISWATRLYATLSLYAQGNRYLPDALLKAQRINVDDLRSHMSQFRSEINQRIRKISTLAVPSVLPIFARHSWLFSNYFIEGESIKDQVYLFCPEAWYQFQKDDDGAGMLKCYRLIGSAGTGLISCQDIYDILDAMIDPIFADEDFNIVSGDVLKAYGESNIFKLGLIPDELPIGLAYEEEVLLQFKNAKTARVLTKSADTGVRRQCWYDNMFDVIQDTGKTYLEVLRSVDAIAIVRDFDSADIGPTTAGNEAATVRQAYFNEWSKATLLTSPHSDVHPEENMINTRLTLAFDIEYDDDPDNKNHVIVNDMYFGSEWPWGVDYYCYHRDKSTGVNQLFSRDVFRIMSITPSRSTSTDACVHSYLPIRSSFKYAPELSIIENQSYVDEDEELHVQVLESGRSMFEVDNYTLVESRQIGMLHNAAIQGEYNIPKIALFATK